MYSLYTYVIKYHNSNNILPIYIGIKRLVIGAICYMRATYIYASFSSILIAEGGDWPIGGSVKAYAYL